MHSLLFSITIILVLKYFHSSYNRVVTGSNAHIQNTAGGKNQGRFSQGKKKKKKIPTEKCIHLDIHLNAAVLYFVTKRTDNKLVDSHICYYT